MAEKDLDNVDFLPSTQLTFKGLTLDDKQPNTQTVYEYGSLMVTNPNIVKYPGNNPRSWKAIGGTLGEPLRVCMFSDPRDKWVVLLNMPCFTFDSRDKCMEWLATIGTYTPDNPANVISY